jgi:hypothetical protein
MANYFVDYLPDSSPCLSLHSNYGDETFLLSEVRRAQSSAIIVIQYQWGHIIKTEVIGANVLKIIVPDKLKTDDFQQVTPQVDSLIVKHGQIRLLIDATGFHRWENITAFETHAGFIKNHQEKIERLAVIVSHEWQHWLVGVVRIFVHPKTRAFDKNHENEALQWFIQ